VSGIVRKLTPADTARLDARLFLALCHQRGLPAPVTEHRFSPPRRWRFDYSWIEAKVALESDGGIWSRGRHTRPAGYLADLLKLNTAAALGWRVLRVDRRQLLTDDTIALVRAALNPNP
jgi:very-short-patch-repair endonuclease